MVGGSRGGQDDCQRKGGVTGRVFDIAEQKPNTYRLQNEMRGGETPSWINRAEQKVKHYLNTKLALKRVAISPKKNHSYICIKKRRQ